MGKDRARQRVPERRGGLRESERGARELAQGLLRALQEVRGSVQDDARGYRLGEQERAR